MSMSLSKKIAYTALFTALCATFNIFVIDTGVKYFMVSLVAVPCFFAGIMLGGTLGFIVGFLGDLIGAIIHPLGPYLPLCGIASGLLGLIPGVIFKIKNMNFTSKIILSAILCLVICTAGLNTFQLYIAFSKGKTFIAYLGLRLPFQIVVWIINIVLIFLIDKSLVLSKARRQRQK